MEIKAVGPASRTDRDKSFRGKTGSAPLIMKDLTTDTIAEIIENYLKIKGNTKAKLAEKIGVSRQTIYNILDKETEYNLTLELIQKLLNETGFDCKIFPKWKN